MTLALALALACLGVAVVTWVALAQHIGSRLRADVSLEVGPGAAPGDRQNVTVILTPHANIDPALSIQRLLEQPAVLQVVVVGAKSPHPDERVLTLPSAPIPIGWTSRRWSQQQGLRHANAGWVLLLDGDLELVPGTLATALADAQRRGLEWLSLRPVEARPAGVAGLLACAACLLQSLGDLLSRDRELTTAALLVRYEAISGIGGVERSAARERGSALLRTSLAAAGATGAVRTGHCVRAHRSFGLGQQLDRLIWGDAVGGLLWLFGLVSGGAALTLALTANDNALVAVVIGLVVLATALVVSAHFWGLNHYNRAASWLPVSLGLTALLALSALVAPLRRQQSETEPTEPATAWDTGVES